MCGGAVFGTVFKIAAWQWEFKSMILIILGLFLSICFMICKNSIRHGKFYFNHKTCIAAGYIFYVLIPLFLLEYGVQFHDKAYQLLRSYYICIPLKNKIYYIFFSFIWLAFFFIGCNCDRVRVVRKWHMTDEKNADRSYQYLQKAFFPVIFLFELLLLYRGRSQLFTGYAGDVTASVRGTLCAGLSMLFSMVLLNYFSKRNRGIKAILKNKWGIFYVIFALLILTMGGRLYVVSNLAAFMIAVTYINGNGISLKRLFIYFIAAMLACGFIGNWRLIGEFNMEGIKSVSFSSIIYNILQEPLYTNFSLVTYLSSNQVLHPFSFPKVFLSSWINLVPSMILPDKGSYIRTIADINSSVLAPLGALHYFTAFNIDFGCILTIFIFFFLGYGLSRLERKCQKQVSVYRTIYVLVSSHLMFTLYRDPFSISIVKNIFEFSIFIPAAVSWISTAVMKRKGI